MILSRTNVLDKKKYIKGDDALMAAMYVSDAEKHYRRKSNDEGRIINYFKLVMLNIVLNRMHRVIVPKIIGFVIEASEAVMEHLKYPMKIVKVDCAIKYLFVVEIADEEGGQPSIEYVGVTLFPEDIFAIYFPKENREYAGKGYDKLFESFLTVIAIYEIQPKGTNGFFADIISEKTPNATAELFFRLFNELNGKTYAELHPNGRVETKVLGEHGAATKEGVSDVSGDDGEVSPSQLEDTVKAVTEVLDRAAKAESAKRKAADTVRKNAKASGGTTDEKGSGTSTSKQRTRRATGKSEL